MNHFFQNGRQKFIEIEIRAVLWLINLDFLELSSTVGRRLNALPLQRRIYIELNSAHVKYGVWTGPLK